MTDDLRAPYRIAFDNARDPYAARNALGIVGTGAGLITSVAAPLAVTGGNLTIDLTGYQPIDADLTAISALTGTNTIYYRSAASTWTAVTIGTGLTFTGGTLANSASGTTIAGKLIGVQVFTASGTYTRTAGCTVAVVEVIGGGGGGGGADATAAGQISFAAGGGGGGYSCKRVSPGTTETVTVGAGGAGGVPGVTGPVAGSTTSFGAHCSATGGQEGLSTTAAAVTSPGGARTGGIGSGGDINIAGGPSGIPGAAFSGGFGIGSSGGDAARGGGGGGGLNFTGSGNAGRAYGGGGSGAANWASAGSNKTGGAGAAGVVIVWEFGA